MSNHCEVEKLVLPTLAEKAEMCSLHSEQVMTHMQEAHVQDEKMLVHMTSPCH